MAKQAARRGMASESLNVRVTPTLRRRLDAAAKREGRTRSNMATFLIEHGLRGLETGDHGIGVSRGPAAGPLAAAG